VQIIFIVFVSFAFLFWQLHDAQLLLLLFQPFCGEALFNLFIFQEVDPLIERIAGYVVKAVDFDQVIFGIELFDALFVEELFLFVRKVCIPAGNCCMASVLNLKR
jgi:hypothetical protein